MSHDSSVSSEWAAPTTQSCVGRTPADIQPITNTSLEHCHYSSLYISRAKYVVRKTVSLFADLCELKFQHKRTHAHTTHIYVCVRARARVCIYIYIYKTVFTRFPYFYRSGTLFLLNTHRFKICDSPFWQFSLIIEYIPSAQNNYLKKRNCCVLWQMHSYLFNTSGHLCVSFLCLCRFRIRFSIHNHLQRTGYFNFHAEDSLLL
jgi:hypothetical protein